jgi:hypothetical protein
MDKTGRIPVEPFGGPAGRQLGPGDKYFPDKDSKPGDGSVSGSKPIWYHKPEDWEEAHGMGG